MKYEIFGENMPAVTCHVKAGDTLICTAGAMAWMEPGMEMRTEEDSFGKMMGRFFSGDTLMHTHFTAEKDGSITFAANYPGKIIPVELKGNTIIARQGAFLAADDSVDTDIYVQKTISQALFSGQGIVLQKFSGTGTVLITVEGSAAVLDLKEGETMTVSGGHLAMMEDTVELNIQMLSGFKNILFGHEGFAVITLKGPGKVILQTMPSENLARELHVGSSSSSVSSSSSSSSSTSE
ncbi:MAG: AIM24 family protein [Solobacterium sp.]|nr:AIM24 family protein [Solobacterium sp.]